MTDRAPIFFLAGGACPKPDVDDVTPYRVDPATQVVRAPEHLNDRAESIAMNRRAEQVEKALERVENARTGGVARAAALSPARRAAIAGKAGRTRWASIAPKRLEPKAAEAIHTRLPSSHAKMERQFYHLAREALRRARVRLYGDRARNVVGAIELETIAPAWAALNYAQAVEHLAHAISCRKAARKYRGMNPREWSTWIDRFIGAFDRESA